MLDGEKIESVIIVGGGLSGYTAATLLKSQIPHVNVSLVEGPELNEVDNLCEASLPSIHLFHKKIGLDEKTLLAKTQSTFLYATRYKGFSFQSQDYFLPFADHGFTLQNVEFPQIALWLEHHPQYKNRLGYAQFDEFSLNSQAAKLSKFRHPDANPRSLLSTLSYAYQLDVIPYVELLRERALALGVDVRTSQTITSHLSPGYGAIESIELFDERGALKEKISACLFIDCSQYGTLINGQFNESVKTLSTQNTGGINVCRHRITTTQNAGAEIPTAVEINKVARGWKKRSYLRHQIVEDTYTSEPSAFNEDAKIVSVEAGRLAQTWVKNCIAMGDCAGYVDRFIIGKHHLVQSATLRLTELFPSTHHYDAIRQEYNRLNGEEYFNIHDMNALHYFACRFTGNKSSEVARNFSNSPPVNSYNTQHCIQGSKADKDLSDRLQHKLSLYFHRGHIPFYEYETFSPGIWSSFLFGQGLFAKGYDAMVNSMDPNWLLQQLAQMRQVMKKAADSFEDQSKIFRN